jgi:hypothetical protein
MYYCTVPHAAEIYSDKKNQDSPQSARASPNYQSHRSQYGCMLTHCLELSCRQHIIYSGFRMDAGTQLWVSHTASDQKLAAVARDSDARRA